MRRSGRSFAHSPKRCEQGSRDTKRAPGTPCHVPTASQPTPTVSAAHGLQHTTNTRNYLQLLDRGQGWSRSREGPLVSGPMRGSNCIMDHKHRTQFLRTAAMRQPTMYSYMASHRYLYQIVFTHFTLSIRTCRDTPIHSQWTRPDTTLSNSRHSMVGTQHGSINSYTC